MKQIRQTIVRHTAPAACGILCFILALFLCCAAWTPETPEAARLTAAPCSQSMPQEIKPVIRKLPYQEMLRPGTQKQPQTPFCKKLLPTSLLSLHQSLQITLNQTDTPSVIHAASLSTPKNIHSMRRIIPIRAGPVC